MSRALTMHYQSLKFALQVGDKFIGLSSARPHPDDPTSLVLERGHKVGEPMLEAELRMSGTEMVNFERHLRHKFWLGNIDLARSIEFTFRNIHSQPINLDASDFNVAIDRVILRNVTYHSTVDHAVGACPETIQEMCRIPGKKACEVEGYPK